MAPKNKHRKRLASKQSQLTPVESEDGKWKVIDELVNDASFNAECVLLEKITNKICIRLRNSRYSRTMKQFCNKVKRFKHSYQQLQENCKENDDTAIQHMESLANDLVSINTFSKLTFNLCQNWIQLGQLINHFLIASAIASRISIFCRAIMYYLYELYCHKQQQQENHGAKNKLKPLLKLIQIKPNSNNKTTNIHQQYDLGVPL